MKKYDKRDVAVELLEAAVIEHLDHGRHFAAYNLAAVAEELLSKPLRLAGKRDPSQLKIGMVKAMSRALGQCEGDDKAWHKAFFALKNTLKHMDSAADGIFEANIETNARQKIGDAVRALEGLGLDKSAPVRRFDQYRLRSRSKDAP